MPYSSVSHLFAEYQILHNLFLKFIDQRWGSWFDVLRLIGIFLFEKVKYYVQ